MPDSAFDFDPQKLSQLLHDEAEGNMPEVWKPIIQKYRDKGIIPPALPGGSQLWGTKTTTGQPTSAYKPAVPPAPTMSRLGSAAAEIPGAIEATKSSMKSTGKAVLDTVTDPEAAAGVAGGIAGGLYGGPAGAVWGSGLASGGVAGVREYLQSKEQNRPMSAAPMASAAIVGAGAEATGQYAPGLFKSPIHPIGQTTQKLLGDKAILSDIVDSPAWDFGRNVAQEGFLGRRSMIKAEGENSANLLGQVTKRAERELMPGQTLSPTRSTAGKAAQDTLRINYDKAIEGGKTLYQDFMKRFGDIEVVPAVTHKDPITGVTTVLAPGQSLAQVHDLKSDALKAARRFARLGDDKAQYEAMQQAKKYGQIIESAAPSGIGTHYKTIGDAYSKIVEQYDNPVVAHLREGIPAEELLDNILNPEKFKHFTPFRDVEQGVPWNPGRVMPKHQSISQEDAVHLLRNALGEADFRQLRADAVMQLGQSSKIGSKLTAGISDQLKGDDLVAKLKKIPDNVQSAMFGPTSTQALNEIAEVTAHTQRARSGSGGLWIVMRQPSVAIGLAGSIGALGQAKGQSGTGIGLTTAGAILLSPLIFSAILRSPRATRLFTEAIAAQSAYKPAIIKALMTHIPAEYLREQTDYADGAKMQQTDTSIPTPPTQ